MDKPQELKNCTSVKCILMLIVILYHSMAVYAGGGVGSLFTETKCDPSGVYCEMV